MLSGLENLQIFTGNWVATVRNKIKDPIICYSTGKKEKIGMTERVIYKKLLNKINKR